MSWDKRRLMGLHCGTKGFGFVVFEGEALHDWGTAIARGDKNAMCLRKLARLLDRYSPETVVLESADGGKGRAERIVLLETAIADLCRSRNIDLHRYAQEDVQRFFAKKGARTRQEIAEAVARQLDVLGPRLPLPRKPWQSEPRRMAIFSAAAVALTSLSRRG
jgi:Holliday junction resolvasome RuvABC endonuclease subunit